MYRTLVPTSAAVPWAGLVTEEIESGSPSGSLSLASTDTSTAEPCGVWALSAWATGGWLTAVTVMVTVAVAHSSVVSQIWYRSESVQLKPLAGR